MEIELKAKIEAFKREIRMYGKATIEDAHGYDPYLDRRSG